MTTDRSLQEVRGSAGGREAGKFLGLNAWVPLDEKKPASSSNRGTAPVSAKKASLKRGLRA